MALVPSQLVQSVIMCCLTLVSIALQREFRPYRRASDNQIALSAQILIFLWVFVLLLRIVGLFVREVAAAVVGTLLCVATVVVFMGALVVANNDRLNEKRAEQRRDDGDTQVELTVMNPKESDETPAQCDNEEIEIEHLSSQESEEKKEEQAQELAKSSSGLPWSLLNNSLCGAEPDQEDCHPNTAPSAAATARSA